MNIRDCVKISMMRKVKIMEKSILEPVCKLLIIKSFIHYGFLCVLVLFRKDSEEKIGMKEY